MRQVPALARVRRPIAWILAWTVSGCVTHHLPKPQRPAGGGSIEWSAVADLPRGAYVFVTLDGGDVRQGLVRGVSDTVLTLYRFPSDEALERTRVTRVAQRVQTGTKSGVPWYVGVPLVAALLGGLTGLIAGAIKKNDAVTHASALLFGAGLGAAGGIGESALSRSVYEDRLIYVRP